MRGLRGYILNLADGQGPPTGTVDVSAKPSAKPVNLTEAVELDLAIHRLGALTVRHQPGSASKLKANEAGHFGWDMELSPGPIDVRVTPHDPQTEYRRRFPDESAQIGKAFLTDLERLGWAGGKDGLIWDAVFGGYVGSSGPPPMTDPLFSVFYGNWSFGGSDVGANAGRVFVRSGVAMLAGTVFSIEMTPILRVPVDGESPMDPNTSGQDRWDLLCLRTDWNPQSPEYGKQSFEFIKGTPSATMLIPDYPGNSGNYRRLPLWAVRMKANTSVYDITTGYDLRTWLNPAPGVTPITIIREWQDTPSPTPQALFQGWNNSRLVTPMSTDAVTLAPGVAWDGLIHWSANIAWGSGAATSAERADLRLEMSTWGGKTPGGTETLVWNRNLQLIYPNATEFGGEINAYTFPMPRIPAYQSSGAAGSSRDWSRLRPSLRYWLAGGNFVNMVTQAVSIVLWPVT